ncbi:hypothetical protein EC988_000850 [Linderina pennispora]|nr:hypothetical protein EC988_000850 [Linderina pennispora]
MPKTKHTTASPNCLSSLNSYPASATAVRDELSKLRSTINNAKATLLDIPHEKQKAIHQELEHIAEQGEIGELRVAVEDARLRLRDYWAQCEEMQSKADMGDRMYDPDVLSIYKQAIVRREQEAADMVARLDRLNGRIRPHANSK